MIPPMAASVAGPEPDMAPKNTHATAATMPRPPGTLPISVLATSTSRREIPPPSIRLPASMKNGQASSGNELMPCSIHEPAVLRVRLPVMSKGAMTANPSEYAIGNPSNARAKKNANIRIIISAIIAVHLPLLKHLLRLFYP